MISLGSHPNSFTPGYRLSSGFDFDFKGAVPRDAEDTPSRHYWIGIRLIRETKHVMVITTEQHPGYHQKTFTMACCVMPNPKSVAISVILNTS